MIYIYCCNKILAKQESLGLHVDRIKHEMKSRFRGDDMTHEKCSLVTKSAEMSIIQSETSLKNMSTADSRKTNKHIKRKAPETKQQNNLTTSIIPPSI